MTQTYFCTDRKGKLHIQKWEDYCIKSIFVYSNRKDNINEQADKLGKVQVKKSKKVKGDAFRARKKPRGSKINPNVKPKPIPHKPFSDDPPVSFAWIKDFFLSKI